MSFMLYPASTIALVAGMLFFLMLAAIFDAHGTEVPDVLTVSYALLGICSALLYKNYIAGAIAAVWLAAILVPYRPKFLQRLNERLVQRAYKTEEAMVEEASAYKNEAERFSEKHEKLFERLTKAALVLVPIVITVCAVLDGISKVTGAFLVCMAGTWIVYIGILNISSAAEAKKRQEDDGGTAPEEELTAMGGADMIVFAGMLGFYGFIPFTFGMCATFLVHLCWMLALRLARKDQACVGVPMIPTILCTAPIRLILATTVCPPIVELFRWASQNMM